MVDNGSTDGSAEVARRLDRCPGRDRATAWIRQAASFAGLTHAESDLIAFMDADASLDPLQLPLLVGEVTAAARTSCWAHGFPSPGAWGTVPRLANRLLCRELGRRGGPYLRDLGPMRVARRRPLLYLDLRDRQGSDGRPKMVMSATRARCHIEELDVTRTAVELGDPRSPGRSAARPEPVHGTWSEVLR